MATDGKTQRVAKAVEKMPAIGDLRCCWSAAPSTIGVKTGTIAGDNLNAGVTFEPGGDRVSVAVGQERAANILRPRP
jgi:hypothetical protein